MYIKLHGTQTYHVQAFYPVLVLDVYKITWYSNDKEHVASQNRVLDVYKITLYSNDSKNVCFRCI